MDRGNRLPVIRIIASILLAILLFWFALPARLFDDPLSTVVYDRNGELLGARIAADGQWRFPAADSIPGKYATAVTAFEDRFFRWHPGVNPVSIVRALRQNIQAGEVVSGGSTITMQVIRLAGKQPPRTVARKFAESFLALRLELTTTKDEILKLYANNAPFGGNVVGIEAAAWRYFGTAPENLTWSESALLAVLPNAPALIHPGRNRAQLESKRNRLLEKLRSDGIIDSLTCSLAMTEPLPDAPLPLPDPAHHLTNRIMLDRQQQKAYTTIDKHLQQQVVGLMNTHHTHLSGNEIHNLACLVVEIETGHVLAYGGNVMQEAHNDHGSDVDIIPAYRSTGSILKPLLFAGMLDNGDILPTSLVPDVPVRFGGYAPKNYSRSYEGAVPASQALERSLNIPSVIMLKRYGVDAFLKLLRSLGFSTFTRSDEHYGLTLILGGAETSLWELAGVYSGMARALNHYNRSDGHYFPGDYRMPAYIQHPGNAATDSQNITIHEEGKLSAGSIYLTFKSMLEVNRPEDMSLWYLMSSTRPIAWKTGTSYGFRDAWSVGVTPGYLVAVWAGNADGEGRTGLTGVEAAAPLMFDVFSLLPGTGWFEEPLDDLREAVICSRSGYIAGPNCTETDTVLSVPKGLKSKACPYHRTVHLDQSGRFRVSGACYPVSDMQTASWFILPPLMEYYYKRNDPMYRELPPLHSDCTEEFVQQFEIVYPEGNSHIVIPRELDGTRGKVVLEAAHRNRNSELFWHMDRQYLGSTSGTHRIAVDLPPGDHELTVVDRSGLTASVRFEVISR